MGYICRCFEVFFSKGIGNLPKDSKAKADQIRTIDRARIVKLIGALGSAEMKNVEKAIRLHLEI